MSHPGNAVGSAAAGRGVRLLFVCTGNVCRSPIAERLARRQLAQSPGEAAALVQVESAGIRAVTGAVIHPASAAALRSLGGDDEGFAARRLTPAMVAASDLVLAMTHDHRRRVLELAPRALSRTFTVREAAELLAQTGEPPRGPSATPEEAVRALIRRMADGRAWRNGGSDEDIPDPMGQPPGVHREVARLIAGSIGPVVDAVLTVARLPTGRGR